MIKSLACEGGNKGRLKLQTQNANVNFSLIKKQDRFETCFKDVHMGIRDMYNDRNKFLKVMKKVWLNFYW